MTSRSRDGDEARDLFAVPTRPRAAHRIVGVDGLTEIQRQAYDFVVLNPGVTIQETAVHMRSSHSTATYHLLALTRLGLVEAVRAGRQLRHFPLPRGYSRELYLKVLNRDPKRAALVHFLRDAPVAGMTINHIAGKTGLPFGFVKRTLEQLERMHFVHLRRRHYRYRVEVTRELLAGRADDLFPA